MPCGSCSDLRVIRYRQHKPDGTVVEADWLTNLTPARVGGLSLYRMAKSRWEIENQGFNDAKNRYGLEHICHHHANSILVNWLLIFLALVIERLYRIRYLHRGNHPLHVNTDVLGPVCLQPAGNKALEKKRHVNEKRQYLAVPLLVRGPSVLEEKAAEGMHRLVVVVEAVVKPARARFR